MFVTTGLEVHINSTKMSNIVYYNVRSSSGIRIFNSNMLGECHVGKTVSEEHESTLSLSQPVDLGKKIAQKLWAAENI